MSHHMRLSDPNVPAELRPDIELQTSIALRSRVKDLVNKRIIKANEYWAEDSRTDWTVSPDDADDVMDVATRCEKCSRAGKLSCSHAAALGAAGRMILFGSTFEQPEAIGWMHQLTSLRQHRSESDRDWMTKVFAYLGLADPATKWPDCESLGLRYFRKGLLEPRTFGDTAKRSWSETLRVCQRAPNPSRDDPGKTTGPTPIPKRSTAAKRAISTHRRPPSTKRSRSRSPAVQSSRRRRSRTPRPTSRSRTPSVHPRRRSHSRPRSRSSPVRRSPPSRKQSSSGFDSQSVSGSDDRRSGSDDDRRKKNERARVNSGPRLMDLQDQIQQARQLQARQVEIQQAVDESIKEHQRISQGKPRKQEVRPQAPDEAPPTRSSLAGKVPSRKDDSDRQKIVDDPHQDVDLRIKLQRRRPGPARAADPAEPTDAGESPPIRQLTGRAPATSARRALAHAAVAETDKPDDDPETEPRSSASDETEPSSPEPPLRPAAPTGPYSPGPPSGPVAPYSPSILESSLALDMDRVDDFLAEAPSNHQEESTETHLSDAGHDQDLGTIPGPIAARKPPARPNKKPGDQEKKKDKKDKDRQGKDKKDKDRQEKALEILAKESDDLAKNLAATKTDVEENNDDVLQCDLGPEVAFFEAAASNDASAPSVPDAGAPTKKRSRTRKPKNRTDKEDQGN